MKDLNISFLMVLCEYDSKVIIDGENIGQVQANVFHRFNIIPGDHIIQIIAIDGTKKWEGQIYAPANEQTILKPIMIPTDSTIGISGIFKDPYDQNEYKTTKIKSLEWFAQSYRRNMPDSYSVNNNISNDIPLGRLYRHNNIGSPPVGWRLPTEADFQSLIQLYSDPFDALVDGKSGFDVKFPGFIEIKKPIKFGDIVWFRTNTQGPPKRDVSGKLHPTMRYLELNRLKKEINWVSNYVNLFACTVRFVRDI